jgi:hypothetical protein
LRHRKYDSVMRGWAPEGTEVTLSPWQEQAVRALLDGRHQQTLIVRGRQWGWSTVLETARRYDRNPALLPGQDGEPAASGADAIGPPPASAT